MLGRFKKERRYKKIKEYIQKIKKVRENFT